MSAFSLLIVHCLRPDTSSARKVLFRPVSYYAIFKGWLLLSQPPGCHGLTDLITRRVSAKYYSQVFGVWLGLVKLALP